jgi:hypothetical protein
MQCVVLRISLGTICGGSTFLLVNGHFCLESLSLGQQRFTRDKQLFQVCWSFQDIGRPITHFCILLEDMDGLELQAPMVCFCIHFCFVFSPFLGYPNSLWRFSLSSNTWTWINGYSVHGISPNNSIPHYRYGPGSTGDDMRYGYIFGGDVSSSGYEGGGTLARGNLCDLFPTS